MRTRSKENEITKDNVAAFEKASFAFNIVDKYNKTSFALVPSTNDDPILIHKCFQK